MMLIIILSFFSGILSVLAPCVLPVIPVMFGGGLGSPDKSKIQRILLSTLLFIFIFTFLLKVSTAFISISTQTRATISGIIIIIYSFTLLFPTERESLQSKIPQIKTSSGTGGKRGDILLGASLGPIFASCSPTYLLLISTILPASLLIGILGLIAYLIGFGGFLYLLIISGRSLIKKFYGLADNHGRFKKILGVLLFVTGLLIMTGSMKHLEAKLIGIVPDTGRLEIRLQKFLDLYSFDEKTTTPSTTTTSLPSSSHMTTGYQNYDPSHLPSTGDIVLFFHADRCPTCNEAEKNFLASGIPEGLTLLKVNYDKEIALKRKYAILTQTSYVLIKPDGTMLKRWVGGRTIEEITKKIAEAKAGMPPLEQKKSSGTTATAYLAGGCFWCLEGPLEALEGVKEVISGYAGGDKSTASYRLVGRGDTGHREAVKVVYDPGLISFDEIVQTYRTQIDPTDDGGQFADRGFQYTTAIYYQNTEEQQLAEKSKQKLQEADTFDEDIAVSIIPFTSFYEAEEEHQDYYKKQSTHYNAYKKGSGRADFIDDNEASVKELFQKDDATLPDLSHLTDQQKDILFNGGTEPPFNNAYRDNHEAGIYVDVIDGTPLFSSTDKFDSGTGRPSFTRPIDESLVATKTDTSLRMERTEIKSAISNGHLGHVFDDGPQDKGGKRYCINSAALHFIPLEEMKHTPYEKYLVLFE